MDPVVMLALIVLAVVFIFSCFVMIFMCRRRAKFLKQHIQASIPLKFIKLNSENSDAITQLSPLVAQILDSNQWIYDVPGVLQHCVAVLKLSYYVIERLAKISLNSVSDSLDESILHSTNRIMRRFDDLLKAMADTQVDIRLIEARVSSLVSASWALAFPFAMINPKVIGPLNGSLNLLYFEEMEKHLEALRFFVEHTESYVFRSIKNLPPKHLRLNTITEEPLIEHANPTNATKAKPPADADEAPSDPSMDKVR